MSKKVWFNSNFNIVQYLSHKFKESGYIVYGSNSASRIYEYVFDDFFYEPKNAGKEYYIDSINKYNIDIFIPWFNLNLIIRNKKIIEDATGVKIITPTLKEEYFNLINNKDKCYQFFANSDIVKIPEYYVSNNKKDFFSQIKKLDKSNKDVCFKPTEGVFGSGFKKIVDDKLYNSYSSYLRGSDCLYLKKSELENFIPDSFKELMVLEFLSGVEYSADLVCNNGVIIDFNIRKKENGSKRSLDNSNEAIIVQLNEIVTNLELNGFINIQFLENSEGIPYFLEINPRSSGGLFQYDSLEGSVNLIDSFKFNFLN